jgi:hypothetical protein
MSSAAILTAPPADVPALLKYQNDCLRQGRYTVLGGIQRIVLERTEKTWIPTDLEEDLKSDPAGISIEFFEQENWLPVAQVEAAGQQSFLLPLAPAINKRTGYAGFPDKPDRHWVPSGPPVTQKDSLGQFKMVRQAPKMNEQPMQNFSCGIVRGTNLAIYERVAQILVKAVGIPETWILRCSNDPSTGTHMAFLVDRQTGEAHFYGGRYDISKPGQF